MGLISNIYLMYFKHHNIYKEQIFVEMERNKNYSENFCKIIEFLMYKFKKYLEITSFL